MTAFDEAWGFLKADESYTGQPKFGGNQKQPIDMHEYPPGSGRFMSLQQMIEARNADARKNIQEHGWDYPTPNPHTEVGREIIRNYPPIPSRKQRMDRNNIMVSPTGNLSDIPEEQRWNPL